MNERKVIEILPNLTVSEYRTGTYHKHMNVFDNFYTRALYTQNYAWSVYTKEVIDRLSFIVAKRSNKGIKSKCIDVAGGMGYLTSLLRKHDVDIVLNDITAQGDPDSSTNGYVRKNQHVPVDIVAPAQDVNYDEYDVVFMTWPCHEAKWDHFVLEKLKPGTMLIYLGESQGGCTGSDMFHDMLRKDFEEHDQLSDMIDDYHVNFYGIHDHWHVYSKT